MDSEELNIAVANEAFAENKVYMLEKQLKQANDRIKRLEKACGEMVSEEDTYIRLQTWLKAKEDKP
jgi:hypothetical protein